MEPGHMEFPLFLFNYPCITSENTGICAFLTFPCQTVIFKVALLEVGYVYYILSESIFPVCAWGLFLRISMSMWVNPT